MGQHYTKQTVQATAWCKKCHAETQHTVMGGRLGACIVCSKKQEHEAATRPAPPAEQRKLF